MVPTPTPAIPLPQPHARSSTGTGRARLGTLRAAALACALMLGASASAHAYLDTSSPAPFEVVEAGLDTIEITFTMAVEPRFSDFSLLRVDALEATFPVAPVELSPADVRSMNAVLHAYFAEVPASERMVLEVASRQATPQVELRLAQPLEPGTYALGFVVLAIDGHTTDGFLVFHVRA